MIFDLLPATVRHLILLCGILLIISGLYYILATLYWMIFGKSVNGIAIGVTTSQLKTLLVNRTYYHLVYAYKLTSGVIQHGTSSLSSPFPPKIKAGARIKLLSLPNQPDKVCPAGRHLIAFLVGPILIFMGLSVAYPLLFYFPLTQDVEIKLAVVLGFAAMRRFYKIIRSKKAIAASTVVKLNDFHADPAIIRKRAFMRIIAIVGAVALFFVGCSQLFSGFQQAHMMRNIQEYGLRTPGIVVRLQTRDHTSTYPVLFFKTDKGKEIYSYHGSIPDAPIYHAGERVTVLYLPNMPKSTATIDEGWSINWQVPTMMLAWGTTALLAAFSFMLEI